MTETVNLADPQALQKSAIKAALRKREALEAQEIGSVEQQPVEQQAVDPTMQQPVAPGQQPVEQYESLDAPMSFSDYVIREKKNEKKAIIYNMIGIKQADALFKKYPNLSLEAQTKIATTMTSDNQVDIIQAHKRAKKEKEGGLAYFKEAFSEDISELSLHDWSLYKRLEGELEQAELRREAKRTSEDRTINKAVRAFNKQYIRQLQNISKGRASKDNALMQMNPILGLYDTDSDAKTVKKHHLDSVQNFYKGNVLGLAPGSQKSVNLPKHLRNENALAAYITDARDILEEELNKGIAQFAFIGEPGEEKVPGKNYFELVNGKPSEEMEDITKSSEWDGNILYEAVPYRMDDGIVGSALEMLRSTVDISQSVGETGNVFYMGDYGSEDVGKSAKRSRQFWYKTQNNEYKKYKNFLIDATSVPFEMEEEEKATNYDQYLVNGKKDQTN